MADKFSGDEILGFWSDVIQTVNSILEADSNFGFSKIEARLNPSLTDVLHSLGIVDAVLNSFLDSGLLDTEETNQALNSKQCVLHIRMLSEALKAQDREEYDKVIQLLKSQKKC